MISDKNKPRRGWARYLAIAVIIVFVGWVAASCSGCSVKYLMQAGAGQAKLLLGRVPVDKVLSDPAVPSDVKDKIRIMLEAKKYGEDKVGIKKTGSYTSYVRVKGDVVSWNLMASPKLELKPVTWHFPIVGTMPYLGYFHRADGEKKEAQLKKQGYDTYLRGASAYSTLGYFKDPIFSSLLRLSKAELANTTLHELTHTTVFIRGHVAYNEGMAQFIGNQSSLDFLTEKFGADSPEVREIQDSVHNDKVFSVFLKGLYDDLGKLYSANMPDNEKMLQREKIFDESIVKFNALPFHGQVYRSFTRKSLNNAAVLSRAIYFVDMDMYEGLYETLNKNLPACMSFFLDLQQKINKGEVADPEVYTREFIKSRKL